MAHTILIVDDEPASVRTIQRTLADTYPIVTAGGGVQGLAALAAHPVALAIVDQRMPDMSGTELLARCAAQHPEIIRILLTGYTDIETLLDAINAGHVYSYLTKPWEPRDLNLVVRRGLERYDVEADRRRLIGELQRACSQLQREADQKTRLLTMAAHELGTPLHVVANALTLLAETPLPPSPAAWLDTARRGAEWLGRGLAQIVDGARWRHGKLKLNPRPLDVAMMLQDLQATYGAVLAARQLTLRLDLAAEVPELIVDRIWFQRALSNLVSNAVRFTPDGGIITLTLTAQPNAVEISVADTGVGIDPQLLDQVFEPFSAASGDPALHTSGRFEFGARGLGLGLAITKAIIEQHGGTISVRSQTGMGSLFAVTVPVPPVGPAA